MNFYLGLMSGTSMDGIDAALVDTDNHELIAAHSFPYSLEVKTRLSMLQKDEKHSFKSICQLNALIGRDFSDAANQLLLQAGIPANKITAIGSHGQTLCHDAFSEIPYTLQIGCPHTIAERTGITVVADFRTRDMVAGGQGAPFAPLYHQALFASESQDVAVVNIGGIANVSLLLKDGRVKGWDVGPGNCLMDAWINQHLNKPYDENGDWALSGKVIPELLTRLLSDPFYSKPSPKSIGKEYFSSAWLNTHLAQQDHSAENIQATLLELTARGIADAVNESHAALSDVYLCGGGVHNSNLVSAIQNHLPQLAVKSTAEKNVSPDYLEAMLFAWLASKTMNHQSLDLMQITGSKHPVIAGAIYLSGQPKYPSRDCC